MSILDRGQQKRGAAMRKELDDISARIEHGGGYARLAFYGCIARSIGPMRAKYIVASDSGRKEILKVLKRFSNQSWKEGDCPASLALGIVALDIESQFVPGTDAAFVKAETAILVLKAASI